MPARKTQEQFIADAQKVWGDRYDFSEAIYTLSSNKVKVICQRHGPFFITANNLLRGHGCPKCSNEETVNRQLKTREQFIVDAIKTHGNRYDYSRVVYRGNKFPVEICCPEHGWFLQRPDNHIHGAGCFFCKKGNVFNTNDFIREATKVHNAKFDYSKVDYKGTDIKVEIICPIHGHFFQRPHAHLKGIGCPRCSESVGENAVAYCLDNMGINYIRQKKFDGCMHKRRLLFDFFIPALNTCIEYQGRQHYEEGKDFFYKRFNAPNGFENLQLCDQIKRDYCASHGIKLIEIRYDENIEQRLNEELKLTT